MYHHIKFKDFILIKDEKIKQHKIYYFLN